MDTDSDMSEGEMSRLRVDTYGVPFATVTRPIFFYNDIARVGSMIGLNLFEPRYRIMIGRMISGSRIVHEELDLEDDHPVFSKHNHNQFIYLPSFDDYEPSVPFAGLLAELVDVQPRFSGGDDPSELPMFGIRAIFRSHAIILGHWVEPGTRGLHYARVKLVNFDEVPTRAEVLSLRSVLYSPSNANHGAKDLADVTVDFNFATSFRWFHQDSRDLTRGLKVFDAPTAQFFAISMHDFNAGIGTFVGEGFGCTRVKIWERTTMAAGDTVNPFPFPLHWARIGKENSPRPDLGWVIEKLEDPSGECIRNLVPARLTVHDVEDATGVRFIEVGKNLRTTDCPLNGIPGLIGTLNARCAALDWLRSRFKNAPLHACMDIETNCLDSRRRMKLDRLIDLLWVTWRQDASAAHIRKEIEKERLHGGGSKSSKREIAERELLNLEAQKATEMFPLANERAAEYPVQVCPREKYFWKTICPSRKGLLAELRIVDSVVASNGPRLRVPIDAHLSRMQADEYYSWDARHIAAGDPRRRRRFEFFCFSEGSELPLAAHQTWINRNAGERLRHTLARRLNYHRMYIICLAHKGRAPDVALRKRRASDDDVRIGCDQCILPLLSNDSMKTICEFLCGRFLPDHIRFLRDLPPLF